MTSKIKRPSTSNVLIFSVFLIILLLIGFIIILCVKLDLFLWNAEYGYNHTSDCYSSFGNNKLIIPCHLENVSSPLNLILSNEIIHDTASETVAVQTQLIRPIKVLPAQWDFEGEQNPTEKPTVFFDTGNFRKNKAKLWDPDPQYKFDAFGKHFHLILHHDSEFVHPEMKITSIFKNSSIAQEPNVNPAGCYYSGYLRNETSSHVIVSLCNGMTGYINSENDSYFIQPAEPFDQNMDQFLHSIYRFESQNSEHDTNYEVPESKEHDRLFEDEIINDVEDDDYELHSHHRNRRSIDEAEKVVELMIFADKNMADYHKSELHTYILIIMSIVSKLFKDYSIGNAIKITVVEIGILSENDIIYVRSTKEEDALSAALNSFCAWKEKHYMSNQLGCKHHDAALLISRDIKCVLNDTNKCYDKVGVSNLGSMCQSHSCSIIRDTGLSTAFTIAHELGHMFNMRHDDDEECSRFNKRESKKKIMSRQLGTGTYPWQWSNCSRHFIREFLDAGNDACLYDDGCRDILKDSDASDGFPGEKYTIDEQCYLAYGKGYTSYSNQWNCSSLWCKYGSTENGGFTNGMPVADGTTCGSGRWCQQGDCVLKGKPSKPINGGWGPWQPFGECSRSCGGGIKRSYRECDSPAPKNGGKFCLGKRVKFQSCNFKECPYGTMDFRAQQCAKFNNNNYGHSNISKDVRWVPFYYSANENSNKKCKLYCRAENTPYYFSLEEKVIDGTPCGSNTYDMCVNGVCMSAGCDHILNSTSVVDICGICGGNNTTCRQVYKNYNVSSVKYGYTRLMVIPAGASNIDIQQRGFDNKKDQTFLALVDFESNKYLLSENFTIVRHPKEIEYHGIIISYSGSNSTIERINTSRPLRKDLVLEVLTVGNLTPVDVVCRYTVPTSPEEYFKWDVTDKWTVCNKVCRGEQERIIRCARKDSNAYVSEESCSGLFKPTVQIKPCNQHCDLRWDVVSQSECSSFCGPGYRIMSYRCFQEFVDQSFPRVELPDVTCSHIDKPLENQTCVGPCDIHRWKYYEWQPCNVTCGNGIQTRRAVCVDQNENVVDDWKCESREKITQKRCVKEKCPLWSTSDWSSCSVTCGMGERKRQVRCQQGNKLVPHSMCSANTKPVHKESCQMTPCAHWITGEWSECSASCGIGEKTRLVSCSVPYEEACQSLFKPSAVEICSIASCTVATTVANATTTTLTTSAFSFSPYSSTSNTVVTQTNEIASGELFFKWISGNWTSCSVSCGEGIRRRNVKCYDIKAKIQVQDYYCNMKEMPNMKETCLQTSCVEWKTTEWSSCSTSCGVGISVRNVWCEANGIQVADENCIHHKPASTVVCDTSNHCSLPSDSSTVKLLPSSSDWRVGRWGECSSPCGGGIKIRHVICQDEYGNEASNCDLTTKPEESVSCNMQPCSVDYRWKYSEWSECSSTCGLGVQRRFAWCVMNGDRNVTDEYCASQNISTLQQTCLIRSCPAVYHWIAAEWSECSVTCGTGFQKRVVNCQKMADSENEEEIVSHYFCNSALRPSTQRECALKSCPNDYMWVPEAWSECSAPCGMKGKQKRKLSCFHRSGKKTKKLYCKSKRKPSRRRKCISNRCEPTNCLELKHKLKTSVDGEYSLSIFGRNISIYCHQMWSDSPTEYLTLPTGENENFSEFFGKRLINPNTCPVNRKNKYNCPCIDETSVRSGKTAFYKIRLNLTSLQVITKDFTFSKQIIGSTIPFGEAGDCYSTVNCPQGSFSINLKGTGLRISTKTSWIKEGINASMHMDSSSENRRVAGKCGGYCAACRPLNGLILDVLPP